MYSLCAGLCGLQVTHPGFFNSAWSRSRIVSCNYSPKDLGCRNSRLPALFLTLRCNQGHLWLVSVPQTAQRAPAPPGSPRGYSPGNWWLFQCCYISATSPIGFLACQGSASLGHVRNPRIEGFFLSFFNRISRFIPYFFSFAFYFSRTAEISTDHRGIRAPDQELRRNSNCVCEQQSQPSSHDCYRKDRRELSARRSHSRLKAIWKSCRTDCTGSLQVSLMAP